MSRWGANTTLFYLGGYAGGGYNAYSTRRDTLGGDASGSPDGGEFDGYIGGGYEFHHGGFTFGPIASVQYTYFGYNGQLGRSNYDSQGGTCNVHWDF